MRTAPRIVVGAKKFTEGAVLGELMAQVLETQAGATVERRFNLAGTQICFDGLRSGALDVYAEYTGTGLREILGDHQRRRARQRPCSPWSAPPSASASTSSGWRRSASTIPTS